jgi:general secretion pathway protein D
MPKTGRPERVSVSRTLRSINQVRFEMKSFALARPATALLIVIILLASPIAVLAKKGEKNFKHGMQYEQAQQWEKAAQEFALAVAASPSDTEYQLHYRRAVFNASQMFMTKGKALAEQGDYVGAYNAFRQAYGLDPVNDLASQEMDRMMRLQREKEGASNPSRTSQTSFRGQTGTSGSQADGQADGVGPREQLQTVQYSGDLEGLIRKLADELSLNVVFDQNFSQVKRTVNIRWKDITPARALDYVFLSQGLFFQKLDRRTILVADQSKRPMYQQLVLRTFYLYNIKPDEARTLLTGALPANAGRQPQFITNPTTNSITVRDTTENMRIIEKLLASVDKDRAEVVMDVSIYEISRTDLLQVGNQVGNADILGTLGGFETGSLRLRSRSPLSVGGTNVLAPLGSGVGLLLPGSSLSLLQGKSNTRLIFSTQVHAFDDEKSETRIGAKVPVQTASVFNGVTVNNGQNNNNNSGQNNAFGNGFPVIQYEDTGLVLDFKPKVYPNQDVQVTMNIETKDVGASSNPLIPTFSQRKISGVARIPNGKTMMIASIAQDRQTEGRTGLPVVGLIPILGRLFTAPRKDNNQSDIVITMTPRVLRAPEILPSDLEERKTGTMQTPESPSLEALVRDAEREERLAQARTLPTNQTVQLPPQPGEEVTYVPAPKALAETATNTTTPNNTSNVSTAANNATAQPAAVPAVNTATPAPVNVSLNTNGNTVNAAPSQTEAANAAANPSEATKTNEAAKPNGEAAKPTDAAKTNDAVKTNEAVKPSEGASPASRPAPAPVSPAVNNAGGANAAGSAGANVAAALTPAESVAELLLLPEQQELKVGERRRLMLFMKTDAPVGLATATLRFDPRNVVVRSISQGILTADKATAPVLTQSLDAEKGVLLVSVAPAAGAQPLTGEGLLLIIEVEGLAAGDSALQFDADKVHLIATDGRTVRPRVSASKFKVTQ